MRQHFCSSTFSWQCLAGKSFSMFSIARKIFTRDSLLRDPSHIIHCVESTRVLKRANWPEIEKRIGLPAFLQIHTQISITCYTKYIIRKLDIWSTQICSWNQKDMIKNSKFWSENLTSPSFSMRTDILLALERPTQFFFSPFTYYTRDEYNYYVRMRPLYRIGVEEVSKLCLVNIQDSFPMTNFRPNQSFIY